jgi:uncharacterized protein
MVAQANFAADQSRTAKQPPKQTFEQIQALANHGDSEAQARMGEAYINGNYGLAVDYSKAIAWTNKAIEQNNSRAKVNLAILYLNGEGVPYDYTKALELLNQAYKTGSMKAARYLGIMYERGLGVPQDYAKAAGYYEQSNQNKDITGQYRLAKLYEQGLGVPRDFVKARGLYLKHTTRFDHVTAPSLKALGDIYALGLGVPKIVNKPINGINYQNKLSWSNKTRTNIG